MNSGNISTNRATPGEYIHISKGQAFKTDWAPISTTPPTPTPPQTLRKLIAFLAFVCLVIDIVIASTRPDGSTALGHLLGIFLPDFLALTMFIKYVRNGLGRYPPRTRITLFTLLQIASLMWPIVSFVDAGSVYTSDGQIWNAYGLNRYSVFFCTGGYQSYVSSRTATFIHLVRSRDFLCLFYLLMAGIELFRSLRLFRTMAADAEKEVKDSSVEADGDGEEIEMAPQDQKVDEDRNFKHEEVEVGN
ncbi:hypothetical protein BG000_007639 [Podila horticola]|nr:hypothetical protein BG000_007639 [Podila horticola]